jgi:hypothetical protein
VILALLVDLLRRRARASELRLAGWRRRGWCRSWNSNWVAAGFGGLRRKRGPVGVFRSLRGPSSGRRRLLRSGAGSERASRAIASGASGGPPRRGAGVEVSRRVPILPWVCWSGLGDFGARLVGWLAGCCCCTGGWGGALGVGASCPSPSQASIGSSSGLGKCQASLPRARGARRRVLLASSNPLTDFSGLDLCRSIRIERPRIWRLLPMGQ